MSSALDSWRVRSGIAEREADELVKTNAVLDSLLSIVVHRYAAMLPPELLDEMRAAITRARRDEADHQANLRLRTP